MLSKVLFTSFASNFVNLKTVVAHGKKNLCELREV